MSIGLYLLMGLPMKSAFLKFCEEHYYFKISFWFWHVIAGLAALAIIGGTLVLLWGILPALKPYVGKPRYPKPVKVSISEVVQGVAPVKAHKAIASASGKKSTQTDSSIKDADVNRVDPVQQSYAEAISNLKLLMPPNKYLWKSKGHWERGWSRNKWVVDRLGIDDRLKTVYRKVNITTIKSKTKLVECYVALLAEFPEKQRLKVLKSAIEYSKETLSETVVNISLLKEAVPNFPEGNADIIKTLASFGRKNPRDGRAFIGYVNKIIPRFTVERRRSVLDVLVKYYYGHFKVFDKQKEATDLFFAMLDEFEPADHSRALAEYYKLFLSNNKVRERRISEIENRYNNDLRNAERTYSERQSNQAGLRALGWKLVGGGIVFIAVLVMFLVLLSIQRELRMLRKNGNV